MDCYIIPPLAYPELMDLGKGNRYFCLAQLYKKDANYRQFFKQKMDDGAWVTLDNGAGDHDLVTAEDLLSITLDLCPSEVIPPDVLFNGISTIRNFELFTRAIKSHYGKRAPQFLACPQGRTKDEWLFVYEYFLLHPDATTIGLSKIAVPKAFLDVTGDKAIGESRNLCYDTLKAKGLLAKPLHLLGMGSPNEMLYYKGSEFIRSTDSCNSVWSAMNGIDWSGGNYERIPTPKEYFDLTMTYGAVKVAERNVAWFKGILENI